MGRCLHPIEIPSPAIWEKRQLQFLKDKPALFKYGRDNLRPMRSEFLTVPCGKCLACLKNKQSSMTVRCLREAQQRGSFAFMTLTYDDDHLPIVESMWRVDLKSGAQQMVEDPEFVSTGFHPEKAYLDLFRSVPGDVAPRYKTFVHCRILEYEWQIRVTPSVCRLDVRQWLKQARIKYERIYGHKLPDFSYVAISEYGPQTCRPHYHLAFFGLRRSHLNFLLNEWNFGKVKQFRMVQAVNKDKSNGFVRASKYIGKYMSKGKFECESVTCGDAQRPRVCQSLHFGTRELDSIADYITCADMFGRYHLDKLCKLDGTPLTRLQVDAIVREIPKRLVFHVDEETTLPIPRIVYEKIFKTKDEETGKTVSSAVWLMATALIRDNASRARDQQFEQFCACNPTRTLSENYAAFAYYEEFCTSVEETVMHQDMQHFYSKSKF